MILFFRSGGSIATTQASAEKVFAVQTTQQLDTKTIEKLNWLFANATPIDASEIDGTYIGPRAAMITPWSTNAVEITQNMDIAGIQRIEAYISASQDMTFDPMLSQKYNGLNHTKFDIDVGPEPIKPIDDMILRHSIKQKDSH